jgi:glutamine amidotransferase
MKLLEEMDPLHRAEISGDTDSEHIFRYLLSLNLWQPARPIIDTVREGLTAIISWAKEAAPDQMAGLNIVLTNGYELIGTRLNRSLYHLHRSRIDICDACGRSHVQHSANTPYRAVEIASEPLADHHGWAEVPNESIFRIGNDYNLDLRSLRTGEPLTVSGSNAS